MNGTGSQVGWKVSTLLLGLATIAVPIIAVHLALQGSTDASNALAVVLLLLMGLFVALQFAHFGWDGRSQFSAGSG